MSIVLDTISIVFNYTSLIGKFKILIVCDNDNNKELLNFMIDEINKICDNKYSNYTEIYDLITYIMKNADIKMYEIINKYNINIEHNLFNKLLDLLICSKNLDALILFKLIFFRNCYVIIDNFERKLSIDSIGFKKEDLDIFKLMITMNYKILLFLINTCYVIKIKIFNIKILTILFNCIPKEAYMIEIVNEILNYYKLHSNDDYYYSRFSNTLISELLKMDLSESNRQIINKMLISK
jgi:hypothetical protein